MLKISKRYGGEHYVKHFEAWHHLVAMLYATIMRFDSLPEIQASMTAETRKLSHLGLNKIPRKSTLEYPEKDWGVRIEKLIRPPDHQSLYD